MNLSVDMRHSFGDFSLDAAFDAGPGLTAIMGRSGAGKTTIAHAVAGILRPDQGRISVDGADLLNTDQGVNVPIHRRRIGYVFQEARLFPHLTVRRNLLYGKWFSRASGREFDRIVDMLGVGPLLNRRPGALSGGERQRVAIARALSVRPKLLCLDEPLSALDEPMRERMIEFLKAVHQREKTTILHVTHNQTEAKHLETVRFAMTHEGSLNAVPPIQSERRR